MKASNTMCVMFQSLASLLLFFLTAQATTVGEQQLLRNGSFDSAYIAGIADEWGDNSAWADVKVKYSLDKAGAHNGLAQKLEVSGFRSGAVQFVQSGVGISRGRRYEIKLWMKGELDSPVEILLRKHGEPYTSYFFKSFKVTRHWQEYELTAISPIDDPNAFFMIRFTSAGTLWVDDASMKDIGDRVSIALAKMGNSIPNGSFEVGLDRWGVEIREAGGYEYEMPVAMLNQRPAVVANNSKVGGSSLKLTIPKHGHVTLTSPYMKINQGRKYSLSLWVAADRNINMSIGLGSGSFGQGAFNAKSIQAGRVWKRHSFSPVLSAAPDDAYYFILESEDEGSLWIDGVQLEEGNATPFSSRSLAEIGLKREGSATLHEIGKSVRLAASVFSEAGGNFSVSVKSMDFYGKTSNLLSQPVTLAPNEQREITFEYPGDHPGYFNLIAEISKKGEVLDSSEMAIGIVPRRTAKPQISSPFGNHAYFNDESFSNAKKLGVGWLRMHPPLGTKWFVVEKNKGKFIFYEESIIYAKSMGFNILGSLDTTPRWASTAPPDLVGQGSSGYRAYPPHRMEDWENYVYQTVLHYKGIIDYWEVWNEPDSNGFLTVTGPLREFHRPGIYAKLLKVAYLAAKRANPNAVIVGGVGTGQPPSEWVEKIFSHGAYDYMDVLSFHYYTDGRPGDALDTPTSVHIGQLKALMRKYGKGSEKPIWESESGIMYPESAYHNILQVLPGYPLSSKDAAAYIVRNYVHLLSSGVSKWFYYGAFIEHRIDRSDAAGFFEWDGSPRPLAIAYANLSWILGNARFSRNLELPDDVAGVEFRDENRIVNVFWAKGWSDDRKIDVTLRNTDSYSSITVYDLMGNVLRKSQNQNIINNIVATKEPIYVVLTK